MCDIVWVSPQSHSSLSVKPHFLWHALQWPWPVRKWFSSDHRRLVIYVNRLTISGLLTLCNPPDPVGEQAVVAPNGLAGWILTALSAEVSYIVPRLFPVSYWTRLFATSGRKKQYKTKTQQIRTKIKETFKYKNTSSNHIDWYRTILSLLLGWIECRTGQLPWTNVHIVRPDALENKLVITNMWY